MITNHPRGSVGRRLSLPGRIWRSIWTNLIWIVAVGFICADLMFAYVYIIVSPVYMANIELVVDTVSDSSNQANALEDYTAALLTDDVMNQCISNLEMDITLDEFKDNISVSTTEGEAEGEVLIWISYKSHSTYVAMRVTSEMADLAQTVLTGADLNGIVSQVDGPWTTGEPVAPARKRMTVMAGFWGMVAMAALLAVRGAVMKDICK